jgi:hypothetical protein
MWQSTPGSRQTEIKMTKTKQQADSRDLPEPIVLTLDQLKEVASNTASGVPQVSGGVVPIRAGGIRVSQ